MILPLLLTLVAPAEEEKSEPPSACEVSWAAEVSPRFIDGTKQRIDRRCRELVDALDYDGGPGSIRIEVGGETYAFTVGVELIEDGEVIYRQEENDEVCECGGNDLSALAMKRVAAAINEHRTPTPPPEVKVQEKDPGQKAEQPVQPQPQPQRHVLRWTGVAVGVVGTGALVAGAILRPQEETRRVREVDGWSSETRPKYEPRNTAIMIGVGAGALGVGAGLLVADVILSKNHRRERATLVVPSATPSSASITLRSRF